MCIDLDTTTACIYVFILVHCNVLHVYACVHLQYVYIMIHSGNPIIEHV